MSAGVLRNSGYGLWNWLQRPLFANLSLSARLHPFSVFKGRQRIAIGDGSRVEPQCRISTKDYGGFIRIGKRCRIGPSAMLLTYGGFIELGDDCTVNPFCVLYGHGGLTIGNAVRIASGTVIIPANHNFSDPDVPICEQGVTSKGIVIEEDVWIAANVTVLDGVRIGRSSVIAAGAVVNKDVEPFSIVGGVPARLLRKRK